MSRLYPLIQLAAALALGASARAETDFNRDIRPILNRNCTGCHGGVKQAGGISFVYQELALGEGKSGARTILPGNPDGSEVIRRVLSRDAEEQMPPQDHGGGKPLPAAEIALLRQWIAEGARWGDHWAFVKPQPQPVPAVKNAAWPVNDTDRFILAKLESENLAPSKAAAPAQWLRRAALDLTGLPPSPEELADFVRGPSYEKAVDRLLASPHFGERWAAMWMDLARYADTQGYEKDNGREIWPWRDWVIRAFNAGMPYDQFTVKQLAGDLLPDASIDDRVATGFHRNTQTNTEGGTNDEEFRLHAVIDRVNTTWTVWQGTTFGCVQCHSHPYDSFRHDDYYRFLSIFNSTEDADLGDDFPRVKVPFEPGKYSEAEALDDEISSLRLKLNATADAATTPWTPLPPVGIKGPEDARFIIAENEVRVGGTVPNGALYTIELPPQTAFTALRIDLLPQKDDPKQWPELGAVLGHLWMELEDPVKRAAARLEAGKIKSGASGQEAGGDGKTGDSNALPPGVQRIGFHAVYADTLTGPFDPEESLTAGPGGGGAFPALLGPRWLVFVPQQPVQVPPGAVLRLQLKHEIFDAETKGAILYHFKIGASLDPAWTRLANDPERSGLQNRLAEARRKREAIPSASSLVMQERPPEARRETRVFLRGNFLAKDKVVQGGTPAILPQLPPGPADRLAVARWLVSPENPLTARVIVNRLWAELFGTGIIGTLEDFGSTGLPPSHPALLDFLALRFQQEQGWSFKALLRELVLSSTYRICSVSINETGNRIYIDSMAIGESGVMSGF